MTPKLVAVVAVARNGVIGADNALPWRVSSDLKRFKALTMGKPMIMGRRSWESVGRPLPGRESVVVTRDERFAAPGAHVAHSPAAGLALAQRLATLMGADEIIVFGGAEIYRALLPHTDAIELTEIGLEPQGDVFFPRLDPADWRETRREPQSRGPRDEADFTYVRLERTRR